ncbi:MAG: HAD family hydrolase [Myxococcota bacterium]|nr:HAD family hydrolase [Myxococcota bacterium]
MLLKAVAFDLDNTIATIPHLSWLQYPSAIPKMLALKNSSAFLRGFRTHHLNEKLDSDLRLRFSTPITLQDVDHIANTMYRNIEIHPAVKQLVQACDQHKIPRAVLSDHPAIEKLKVLRFEEGWTCVLNARAYGAFKPLPDALYALCAQLNVYANELLYVGDRYDTDGEACSKIGCHFVHLSHIDISKIVKSFSKSPKANR